MLGCLQREGVDYEETFAPVAKLDVDSAFPYADLDEEVFVVPPPGNKYRKVIV